MTMSRLLIYGWVLFLIPTIHQYSPTKDDCDVFKSDPNTLVCTHRNLTDDSSIGKNIFQNNYRLNISTIHLDHNYLKNVPDLSDALPELEMLSLEYNTIENVTKKQLSRYKKLKRVCLKNNPINETQLANLKKKLPHINFTCPETFNENEIGESKGEVTTESPSNGTVSTNPIIENVTASYNTEENAKATESPNSVGKGTPTTKSDSILTSSVKDDVTASNTEKENAKATESPNSGGQETPTTKSETTKKNHHSFPIFSSILIVIVFVMIIFYKIYQKRRETQNQKRSETDNQKKRETENQEKSIEEEPLTNVIVE